MQLPWFVADGILDADELAAIQAAVRESAPSGRRAKLDATEPTRLALIADDRSADAARPALMDFAARWSAVAPRTLRGHLTGTWQLDAIGADVVDGATAKAELRGAWVTGAMNAHSEIVIAVQGSVIDLAAAQRCGAQKLLPDAARTPSSVSLRLFERAGKSMIESFCSVWPDAFDVAISPSTDLGIVSRLVEARTVIRATLQFSNEVGGRVMIFTRPDSLAVRPPGLAANRVTTALIANALSNVSVELTVELGTLRMSLGELHKLEHGATHTLPQFVDSRVPVYCGGVLKAWGKPVVSRGVLAVQIISVVHGQGSKS